MAGFIAYYRVSTKTQGADGLGMDAQRDSVKRFIKGVQLAGEYTEVESGKRSTNRPILNAALAECKKSGATLIIAKLDRLARNVHFISGLMESGVDFVAVDMPTANRLTIHIIAAVAEHERVMISQRTKDGLAQAKKRGTKLGNPRYAESIDTARSARTFPKTSAVIIGNIRRLRSEAKSFREIAAELNGMGVHTVSGGLFHSMTVKRLLETE